MKPPKSKLQAPEKIQTLSFKSAAEILEFGAWNFSGIWMLEFGFFS
jgi:hypothetical protein